MHATKLKFPIERRLALHVPVTEIMKNPTVRSLAADLDAQLKLTPAHETSHTSYIHHDPVVVFRANGSKTLLWVARPGVGEILCFLHLSHFLGPVMGDVSDNFEADSTFCGLSPEGAMGRVLEVADKARFADLGIEERALTQWVDVAFSLQRMVAEYESSGTVAIIDVFHAISLRAAASSREEWVLEHLSR
ncbi:hypothetical protein F4780DRAFT_782777 [Xylariomycetidae sp. FL0641]|nr:hypothetical protein F4780DRAFT_782777 [Xylariomycetidae sp. FL0641]